MRVFGQVFCQKLKLSVGFDGAYLGEIRNHRNVCGQHLIKVLLVFFVECAKQGGRAACGFFSLKTFQTCKPSRVLGHSIASGSALRGARPWASKMNLALN